MYVGRSPFHARSVAMVLNITTGRVSPQFHVQFDPGFHTIKPSFGGTSPKVSWQAVCGFAKATQEEKALRKPPPEEQEQPQSTSDAEAQPTLQLGNQSVPQSEGASKSEGATEQLQLEPLLRYSTCISKPVISNRSAPPTERSAKL